MNRTKIIDTANFKFLEDVDHQYTDLCLYHCGHHNCEPGHTFGPGKRSEYIIHYIREGCGIYVHGQKTFRLSSGDTFLICPGEKVYYAADAAKPWAYSWIGFHGMKVDRFLRHTSYSNDNPVLHLNDAAFFLDAINHILATTALTYSNELKRQGYLLDLLSGLVDSSRAGSSRKTWHDYPVNTYVKQAAAFIQRNYHKPIHISDVAEYVGITRSYLTSSFQKILNITPQKYLLDCRMHQAADLLKCTDYPIASISKQVGYDDALAFSKIFKKEYGLSPRGYRQSLSNEKG